MSDSNIVVTSASGDRVQAAFAHAQFDDIHTCWSTIQLTVVTSCVNLSRPLHPCRLLRAMFCCLEDKTADIIWLFCYVVCTTLLCIVIIIHTHVSNVLNVERQRRPNHWGTEACGSPKFGLVRYMCTWGTLCNFCHSISVYTGIWRDILVCKYYYRQSKCGDINIYEWRRCFP